MRRRWRSVTSTATASPTSSSGARNAAGAGDEALPQRRRRDAFDAVTSTPRRRLDAVNDAHDRRPARRPEQRRPARPLRRQRRRRPQRLPQQGRRRERRLAGVRRRRPVAGHEHAAAVKGVAAGDLDADGFDRHRRCGRRWAAAPLPQQRVRRDRRRLGRGSRPASTWRPRPTTPAGTRGRGRRREPRRHARRRARDDHRQPLLYLNKGGAGERLARHAQRQPRSRRRRARSRCCSSTSTATTTSTSSSVRRGARRRSSSSTRRRRSPSSASPASSWISATARTR